MTDSVGVVRSMIEAYCQMDADALAPLLHPAARHTAPGSDFGADMEGRSAIVEYFRQNVFPAFERVNFEIVFVWEDRGRSAVVVEWRSHLWPRTGKHYSNTGVFVIEFKDGLVYWVREYFDTEKAHRHVTA
jgi:ketosteroid isomerase-like protein